MQFNFFKLNNRTAVNQNVKTRFVQIIHILNYYYKKQN